MLFSGIARVREWYDEKARQFRIVVDVQNRTWGPLFGYRGSFYVEWHAVAGGQVPAHILPSGVASGIGSARISKYHRRRQI
jgi:hypothetical protein